MFEDWNLLKKKNRTATIDMGPLIDMVFILLIFFIVTTNFNRETGVEVTKPKASTAVSQGQKTLLVGISREGTIHVQGRQLSLERLKVLLAQESSKRPDMTVVIVSDQEAAIKQTIQVMDVCALAGASKVSIAAEQH
jgi:biopolymer transport protein ExbD